MWPRGVGTVAAAVPAGHGPYRIDTGRPGDLPAIAALEAAVFPEPASLETLEHLYADPRTRLLVARLDATLCAYFAFQVEGPTAHVHANATDPAHRRQGLASALLDAGELLARRSGARWFLGVVRRSNAVQLDLLRDRGWQALGPCPGFFGNGEDAWVVWHLLA